MLPTKNTDSSVHSTAFIVRANITASACVARKLREVTGSYPVVECSKESSCACSCDKDFCN